KEKSLLELLQAHQSKEATPLDQLRPDVPAGLAAVVARMMAKRPEHRFQTPREVAGELVRFYKKGAEPTSTSPTLPAEPPPIVDYELADAPLPVIIGPTEPARP